MNLYSEWSTPRSPITKGKRPTLFGAIQTVAVSPNGRKSLAGVIAAIIYYAIVPSPTFQDEAADAPAR